MLYGSISLLIFLLIKKTPFNFEYSLKYNLSLVYLSVFGSVFGFSLYLSLIKKIGSNDAAYVAIIMPLIALLVSTIFEEFSLECEFIFGAIMIIFGNILILKNNFKYL